MTLRFFVIIAVVWVYIVMGLMTSLCFVGPTDLHTVPATTTHMYGWWMKEDALKTEPWTYTERRPHVNSEMTRYGYISLLLKDVPIALQIFCSI